MLLRARLRLTSSAAVLSLATVASAASQDAAPAAEPSGPLQSAVRTLVNEHSLKDGDISIEIADVETGRILGAWHEHEPVNPASNAKVYTAATALATLHGDHHFETVLVGTAKSGVVSNLGLRGYGDPSLTTKDLFEMAEELRGSGVKKVTGDILVDQRFFDAETTPPGFEQQPAEWAAFRAPVSSVAIDENTITLTVRPGEVGSAANVRFDPPGFVDVEGEVKTSDGGADAVVLELTPTGRRLHAKLSGTVSNASRVVRYTRRVEDPQLLAGYALRAVLQQVGIEVGGDVKLAAAGNASVLARHESAPLSELLYALGKQSDNFYAEMVFKSLGGETHGRPAKSADGALVVTKFLDSVQANDTGVVVKNGSGLFDNDRTTAASMVAVLRAAWKNPEIQPEFVAQLAVGGVDGTLKHRFRGALLRRMVRAKTGTLEDASALSGYVFSPSGKPPVAFSVVMNHVGGKVSYARVATDALVGQIAKYLR